MIQQHDRFRPDYATIVGQGRSGTNWLLDLLDLSPQTHCRNEANELAASLLAKLPSPTVRSHFEKDFGERWDRAIALSAVRLGMRDRIGAHPKDHLYEPVRQLGGATLLSKRKFRQLLSLTAPNLGESEWPVPGWLATRKNLEQAFLVLKLNQVPAWAEWLLLNRPKALVVHIVRHPGGFLHSWRNRYLAACDPEAVKKANYERLQQIVNSDSGWGDRFGNLEAMSVAEMELWYWCYATETIHKAGYKRDNYLEIVYENLVRAPLETAQQLYEKCHLPWTVEIEKKVTQSASGSNAIATAWRNKLTPKTIHLVERIVNNSLMSQWWE
jgi:Sulfotransferase family